MAMAKKAKEFKLTTKQKIEGAGVRKRLGEARVKEDKSIRQFPTTPAIKAKKAENVRRLVDASKTAGRAKNVELKLKKAAAKKMK